MKTKNIIGLVAIVAVAVAMAFNVTVSNTKTDTASLLALKNVEALASFEYVIGSLYCPCAGQACPRPYGGNIQYDPRNC